MLWIFIMIVAGAAKWIIYTALLWIMIKIQKMQYKWLGLLGSSALATALGYIPVVGPYVGWAALVLCLWKVTHADIAPDVLFTVSIAGALMFCVNLFAIGALMGDLTLGKIASDDMDDKEEGFEFVANSDDDEADTETVALPTKPLPAVPQKPAHPERATNAPVVAVAKTTNAAPADDIRDASSLPTQLSLKGLGLASKQRTAMISAGREIHTVTVGDLFSVASPKGTLVLRCQEITPKEVILALDKGERVRLGFQ